MTSHWDDWWRRAHGLVSNGYGYVGRHRADLMERGPDPDSGPTGSAADLPAGDGGLGLGGSAGVLEQQQGDVVVELPANPLDERTL